MFFTPVAMAELMSRVCPVAAKAPGLTWDRKGGACHAYTAFQTEILCGNGFQVRIEDDFADKASEMYYGIRQKFCPPRARNFRTALTYDTTWRANCMYSTAYYVVTLDFGTSAAVFGCLCGRFWHPLHPVVM